MNVVAKDCDEVLKVDTETRCDVCTMPVMLGLLTEKQSVIDVVVAAE